MPSRFRHPPLFASLSLYRFLLSISRFPLRFVLSVRKGGSRETLAPYRNYRLAGINSRVYIEWRKTRREGSERAQEGQGRERERERKWAVVQSWIWRLSPPTLLVDVSFPLSLFLALFTPSSSSVNSSSLFGAPLGVSLSFQLWYHQHCREMAAVHLIRKRDSSVPCGKGEKCRARKRNVDRDGRNWRGR